MFLLELVKICIELLKLLFQFHIRRIPDLLSVALQQMTVSQLTLESVLKSLNVVWSVALLAAPLRLAQKFFLF